MRKIAIVLIFTIVYATVAGFVVVGLWYVTADPFATWIVSLPANIMIGIWFARLSRLASRLDS